MSTTPRFEGAFADQPVEFGSVMAHTPETLSSFFALYGHFWQQGLVAAPVKEMTRIRNARITDCGY